MALDLQFYTLFVMILTGVGAGLVFDLVRALRGITRARGIVGDLWDLLFWVLLTVLVAAGLVIGNWGHLRFSILLGVLVGLWIYSELASELVLRVFRHLFLAIGRVLAFALHVLETIVVWPLELLLSVASLALQLVVGLLMLVMRGLGWLLLPFWMLVYPALEPRIGYYRHRIGPLLYLLRQVLR